MSVKSSRSVRGSMLARRGVVAIGAELRQARLGAGLSQARVARASGMSGSQVGRIERGELRHPTVDQLSRIAAVVGLELSIKLYPGGAPVRDAGQLALLARLEARLPRPLRLRREVPLPIPDDRRAWDGRIEGDGSPCAVEAEVHLLDVQATSRRIAIKVRDDPVVGRVVLLVARSAHNRAVLREHREALRGQFPLDGASVLASLRRGEAPSASGILML